MNTLFLVRPNLGNPLILSPYELKRFEITIAGKTETVPPRQAIYSQLQSEPPKILWKKNNVSESIELKILQLHDFFKHPEFESDYGSGKFADSAAKQQYERGYRWEIRVTVGISEEGIQTLKDSFGWPTLLNLRFGTRTNSHALYIHETLGSSSEFTILHITDTHIAQRNDLLPELLSEIRNKEECEELKKNYINFNDNLRAFIKLANKRLREGEKVIVVVTGDIIDHYFDGYWNGKFVCGQGGHAPDKRKEAAGRAWNSNVKKFREIILGTDKKGEELLCPLFTVLGNHDYLMNEVLLGLNINLGPFKVADRNSHGAFGLSEDEGREYDYWAFPRKSGKHRSRAIRKTFKENINSNGWKAELNQDWSYWLGKPKSWQLSQYIDTVNYDTDFTFKIGKNQFLCLNTSHDRYPRQEEFVGVESREDEDRDYLAEGPHNRGITDEHLRFLQQALTDADGFVFIFTHAPLVGLQNDATKGMNALFEENHVNEPNKAISWLSELYGKSQATLVSKGFLRTGTKYFKQGTRNPYLNFSCADGKFTQFLDQIARVTGKTTETPILVFSGHTHAVHEFRIEKIRDTSQVDENNFYYFLDDYSGKYLRSTANTAQLRQRARWLMENSPLLVTSGALKSKKVPQYREIVVSEKSIASLEMKKIPKRDIIPTARFTPGCRSIALKTWSTDKYVCANGSNGGGLVASSNRIGREETFELITLEDNKVALRACNGKFVRAENGGNGKVKADRRHIESHETFELEKMGGNNAYAFRTLKKGTCLSLKGGGTLLADKDGAKTSREKFILIELD